MYGQKNYNELQGINGKYRINQIGCFLTSFSNLLERFGRPADPLTLNRIFRDNGIYVDVDDGVKDDLSWNSITRANGNVVVTGTGNGAPPHSNAIVKFTGVNRFGTHFCLVADRNAGTIIDSWDGIVKHWSVYGGPKAWATYEDRTPKPAPAPTPPPVQAPPVSTPEVINITVQSGWGLSHILKAAGYNQAQFSNPTEWQRLSVLNGAPQGLKVKANQVVKVNRTPLAIQAPQPITPVLELTKPEPVTHVEALKPVVEGEVSIPVKVNPTDPNAYKNTFKPEDKVYIAKESLVVKDMDGLQIDVQLVAGQKVASGGTFEKRNTKNEIIVYVRTKRSIESNLWYGVPQASLDAGQDPNQYVGPLIADDEDSDIDDLFDLDMAKEIKVALNKLSSREKIVDEIAKVNLFARIKLWIGSFITVLKRSKKTKDI